MHIPSGYCQVNLQFTGTMLPNGAEVTYGINQPDTATPGEVAAIVSTIITDTDVMDRFSNQLAITNIHVKFGPNATGPFADLAVNKPGQSTADMLAPNTSLLVQKRTDQGGKSGAGRFNWPGLLGTDVTDSQQVGSTALAAFQSQFDDFLASHDAAACTMVLLHSEDVSSDVNPLVITALNVASRPATIRRRLRP